MLNESMDMPWSSFFFNCILEDHSFIPEKVWLHFGNLARNFALMALIIMIESYRVAKTTNNLIKISSVSFWTAVNFCVLKILISCLKFFFYSSQMIMIIRKLYLTGDCDSAGGCKTVQISTIEWWVIQS